MSNSPVYHFVSRTTPPADCQEPAYWFIFQEDKLLVHATGDHVEVPCVADLEQLFITPLRQQYLGYLEDDSSARIHCYAAEVDPDAPIRDGLMADGLRQLYPQLGDLFFTLAGRAVQIVDWDRTNQFCGRCATPMQMQEHERAKKCPQCGLTHYPRISPAIIIAVTRRTPEGNRLLMARNHRFPPGRYSVVAGFVEPGESLEDCAQREVLEEVGIQIDHIRYFGSQSWPFPNSLMVGFTAEYAGGEITLEEAEIADAQWFAADSLPGLPPKMSIARRLIDAFVAGNS
jgi:NAD+ diphosphatase